MPLTTHVTTIQAKEEFSELINRVSHHKEHIIITRRGHEVAAIIPLEDLLLLQTEKNKNELEEAVEALNEARKKGVWTIEDLKKEVS